MKRTHAFTLIELLMMVAIVGILMSIAFPLIGVVRDAAHSVRCTSALRQIGMGCILYAKDRRGYVPDSYTGIGGIAWNQLIDSYLDTDTATFKDTSKLMWECPMWRRRPSVIPYGSDDPNSDYWRVFGFGMNPRLKLRTAEYAPEVAGVPDERTRSNDYWFDLAPLSFRLDSISFRSNRALIGDSTNNRIYTNGPALSWSIENGLPSHNDPERHHGRANYVFCDGHASSLSAANGLLAVGDPEYLP